MRMFRSVLGYVALALASCLSIVGLASATERLVAYHFGVQAVASVGKFGEDLARFKAETSYMSGSDVRPDLIGSDLTRQSNGFIQKVLASISGSEARIGVGNGLTT